MSHVGGTCLDNASHTSDIQPTTTSHVAGINYVEKPTWIGGKPNFPFNICKGDHLTHLFPGLAEER
jgi:hypothetical protein